MKKNEMLKTVVILQAVCMIALTGMVMVKVWPLPGIRDHEQKTEKPVLPSNEGNGGTGQSGEGKPGSAGQEIGQQVVASVGGKSITRGQLTEELYAQYGDAVLRVMMVRQAIDLEAESEQLGVSQIELDRELAKSAEGYESEQLFFDVMKEQLGMTKKQVLDDMRYKLLLEKITVRNISVTDDEVERYIDEHPEQFAPRLQLHLYWIVTNTKEQAEDLLKMLEEGEAFSELAKAYSLDEFTAELGGDLGMVDIDDPFYDKAVLTRAQGMDIAEIAGPIELEQGFAIIELAGRKTTSGLTGHRLADEVRKQLALEKAPPIKAQEEKLLKHYQAAIQRDY